MAGAAPRAVVTGAVTGVVVTRLRAVSPAENDVVQRWREQPSSPYEDFSGPPPPGVGSAPPQPRPPGGGQLAVTDRDDALLGTVGWHPVLWGPSSGSIAMEIGISLRPEARRQGHGTRAQRLLADYLFSTTGVHRVQASTDVGNLAEQRALERAGFIREGVLRQAQWRRSAYHDLVLYARLRTDD